MKLLRGAASVVAWIGLLWAMAFGIAFAAERAYMEFMGSPLELSPLMWLSKFQHGMAVGAVIAALPLGLISSLPMRNDWDSSLQRLRSLVIALYALALLAGLIMFAVGIGLQTLSGITS